MNTTKAPRLVGVHSGRKGKICEQSLEHFLKATGASYHIYALTDYPLQSCDACMACMNGRGCVKADGLAELAAALASSAGIVFAAPEYWQGVNGKARSFWERLCFSGRHAGRFPYAGIPAVAVGVGGDGNADHALGDMLRFMREARMPVVDSLRVQGQYACFHCGIGESCPVSGLWDLYSPGKEIDTEDVPGLDNQGAHCEGRYGRQSARPQLQDAARRLMEAVEKPGL